MVYFSAYSSDYANGNGEYSAPSPAPLTDESIIKSIDSFFEISDLNQSRNPDAEIDLKLYDEDSVDHEKLDGNGIARSFSFKTGAHVFSREYDISGYTEQTPLQGYLLSENPTFFYDADGTDVYLLEGDNGDQLLTDNLFEIKEVLTELDNYSFKGFSFRVEDNSVSRFYNAQDGLHHFTADTNEIDVLNANEDWTFEGLL